MKRITDCCRFSWLRFDSTHKFIIVFAILFFEFRYIALIATYFSKSIKFSKL
nr:MAG TPA: hypothetical protein [Caudoviricetes sp.]